MKEKNTINPKKGKTEIDGGSVKSDLNSDNAFSDTGLANAEKTRKSIK